jgi:tRNA nucleotidyltransferase/poly(A) polymerase
MNEIKSKRKRIIRESEVLISTSSIKENKTLNFSNINDKILREIGKIADENKCEVYAVGGIVRDTILGLKRQDYDFTVVGDSIEFAKIVAEYYHSKPVIFQKFLTAMVPLGKEIQLEFVGTRKEIYKPIPEILLCQLVH